MSQPFGICSLKYLSETASIETKERTDTRLKQRNTGNLMIIIPNIMLSTVFDSSLELATHEFVRVHLPGHSV